MSSQFLGLDIDEPGDNESLSDATYQHNDLLHPNMDTLTISPCSKLTRMRSQYPWNIYLSKVPFCLYNNPHMKHVVRYSNNAAGSAEQDMCDAPGVSTFYPSTQGTIEPFITKTDQVVNTSSSQYKSSQDMHETGTNAAAVNTSSFVYGNHQEKPEARQVVNTSFSSMNTKLHKQQDMRSTAAILPTLGSEHGV
ncbi:hypothetical protein BOTCAL_0506g00040 [Botryotinia calthae]|uniref:Uncharacterized protein n=1 Tax=Botryotinia calthae TaxID=38488 RepID=A0A4Y8CLY5_9HELO|nr:hypothetical protein BOTCAL_0506g00040 [Botryotinia calthae]